jgi:hypothetical protein
MIKNLRVRNIWKRWSIPIKLISLSLIFTSIITFLFYPGFMSYDSLHALRGARYGVTDSIWPPMVSYVWMFADIFSTSPSSMHFLQVFTLLSSLASIIYFFTKKIWCAALFLLCYLIIPVVLGTISVIWKDVLMASFLFFAFFLSILIQEKRSRLLKRSCALMAIFFIFLGVCCRHNAITAAVPIIFYLSYKIVKEIKFLHKPRISIISILLLASVLIGFLYTSKLLLDNYALPSLKALPNESYKFIIGTRILDIAGASVCAKKSFFEEINKELTLEKLNAEYDPRHINLSASILAVVGFDKRINDLWFSTFKSHPYCFFNNKLLLTKYLIGANKGEQFLVTSAGIDRNEFGYKLPTFHLRDRVVQYIYSYSQVKIFRPWFLYLIAISITAIAFFKKIVIKEQIVLISSSAFYFMGIVFFGNAADARLLFYTTSALMLSAFISLFYLILNSKQLKNSRYRRIFNL